VPSTPAQTRILDAVAGRSHRATGLPRLDEIAVLALASSRLTRAISLDEITSPLRDRLGTKARGGGPVWSWAHRLLSCPACLGWWVSLAVSLSVPGRHRLLRGASVAGGQVFLALLERLVSEEGRAAIHGADLAKAHADALDL
jgi:hypothetical protein